MIDIATWQDAELPFTVEYARPAFERIRRQAAEGLIALPRVGMGVGGLLLGERTPTGIRVAGTVELPCSHTLGPTFQLTPDEVRQSLELVKSAAAQRAVVGIYCSHTRGALAMVATDRELFDVLCPEPWQIALALRPAAGEPTKAAVFVREAGELAQGTIQDLWEWRPAELDESPGDSAAAPASAAPIAGPPPVAPLVAPAVAPEVPSPPPMAPTQAAPTPKAQPPVPPKVKAAPPAAAKIKAPPAKEPPPPVVPIVAPRPNPSLSALSAAASGNTPEPSLIEMPGPVRPAADAPAAPAARVPTSPKRPINPQFAAVPSYEPRPVQMPRQGTLFGQPEISASVRIPPRLVALAAGLVFLVVAAAVFATKDEWLPRPPLTLTCSDSNGVLEIRWNAAAARGVDRGSLLINDGGGGQLDTVSLDPQTLLTGSFLYKRKSDRVTVTLDLGDVRARTAFPPEPDGSTASGTSSGGGPDPDTTTLPSPPPSGAISPYGNPPPPSEPAADTAPAAVDPSPAPAPTSKARPARRPSPPRKTDTTSGR